MSNFSVLELYPSYIEYAKERLTLEYGSSLCFYTPFCLLSVESELINSIRWHKSRHHDLPFVWLRRSTGQHDTPKGDVHPLSSKVPLYRLDHQNPITDPMEYDTVSCARALFRDIEDLIKKTNRPRFGIFQDMSVVASRHSDWFDILDGGLFMTWANSDGPSEVRSVQCNVFIAGEK